MKVLLILRLRIITKGRVYIYSFHFQVELLADAQTNVDDDDGSSQFIKRTVTFDEHSGIAICSTAVAAVSVQKKQ